MARTRTADNPQLPPKPISLEEIETGTSKLQEVLAAINDFSQEGFPYRDAARSKAELQLRECVKRVFGERSHEFQAYRNYKLRTSNKTEAANSIAAVKDLIRTLEDKKLELQGIKPQPIAARETQKIQPSTTAQIRLVEPATQKTIAQPLSHTPTAPAASHRPATASTTQPIAPLLKPATTTATPVFSATQEVRKTPTPSASVRPQAPAVSATQEIRPAQTPAAQVPSPTTTSVRPQAPAVSATQEIRQAPTPSTQVPSSATARVTPQAPAVSTTQEIRPVPEQPAHSPVSTPLVSVPSTAALDTLDMPPFQPLSEQETLKLVRKVCLRLHAVARQLRLRKDSRPTVEIEDDYDLQDLLRALLKMEFDEVGTDEWTPPYAGSVSRTTLLLNREQIAIVAKKTRSGMTTKEIAEQVSADSAFYSARNRCTTLFCFVYDPEGRIGSPKRLETDLTRVSDRYNVEVLVAPK
ncbi:MAG: hypothetical protein A4E20_08265 [Nitrospira sp. SG-bin2]|uniref:PD-(D/E)XK nuclease domain-containing protein n=1 Tax=Nitrospira cf. moscoviensis SBR1015 TaxID=96242 RepID=UPI000A0EBB36|nr:hypothetical protein [Nitrospira cf. moscoviensis SBR1015]OQW36099.1 MAG: hypothetical protein A4E20_08265 [Nitrospira sp. SG-bin2]